MLQKARSLIGRLSLVSILLLLTNCAKQENKEKMELEELKKHAFNALDKKKHEEAIDTLEHVITRYADHPDISKFKLLLADTYFKEGKFPQATKLYGHFVQYYPSDEKAEYAHYKAILSQFYQTLRVDCDQSTTATTIGLCEGYTKVQTNKQYLKDVLDIQNTCEHKLIDKEIYVFNFYLKEGNYNAATSRLASIRKLYAEKKPALEPRLLYLECKLAKHQNKDDVVEKNIQTLYDKFPHSQFTQMTKALIQKREFVI